MWNSRIEVSNVDLGEVLGSPLVRCPQARGLGSIPGRGTEILQARQCGQKKKKNHTHTKKMWALELEFSSAIFWSRGLAQCNFSCFSFLLCKMRVFQWFLTRYAPAPSWETFGKFCRNFWLSRLGGGVLLAAGGWKQGCC